MEGKDKTNDFIKKYLCERAAVKGDGLYRMVADSKGVDKRTITKVIRTMEYRDFLKTLYWRLVSNQVKHNAKWKCSECGRSKDLVAHHDGYRLHGVEMYHVHELHCLCRACHERLHGLRA